MLFRSQPQGPDAVVTRFHGRIDLVGGVVGVWPDRVCQAVPEGLTPVFIAMVMLVPMIRPVAVPMPVRILVCMVVPAIVPVVLSMIVIVAVVGVGTGHGVILSRWPGVWPAVGTQEGGACLAAPGWVVSPQDGSDGDGWAGAWTFAEGRPG